MTLPIFPDLLGVAWDTVKSAEFRTNVFETLSGVELRYASRKSPRYTFKLSLTSLMQDEAFDDVKKLLGFMLARKGKNDAFLYLDPNDNRVVDQLIGIGNGVETQFQLIREYGVGDDVGSDVVNNVKQLESLLVNGVYMSAIISDTGLITFSIPPANNAEVRWTGSYYYRVRFAEDKYDITQLMYGLHECKDISFVGSTKNIV